MVVGPQVAETPLSEPTKIEPGHRKTEDEHRRDICAVGRWVHQLGFVAATDGNISVRLDPDRVMTTPTLMSKGMLEPEDLVVVDTGGRHLLGRRKASSELAMHLLIYQRRSDVNAVVHCHPATATGYAASGLALNQALISEVVLALGCVPLAEYGTPGTHELTDALKPLIPQYDAVLMANHGVVTYGPDLLTAYMRMETVEHFARISLVSHLLGGPKLLSRAEVDKLGEARERYFGGQGAPVAPLTDFCPVSSEPAYSCGCGHHSAGQRFSVTRAELEAMIDEAVKSGKVR